MQIKYLEENVDKTYLDVGVMTKHLQDRYPEYSRRKISPFRALVEQGSICVCLFLVFNCYEVVIFSLSCGFSKLWTQ